MLTCQSPRSLQNLGNSTISLVSVAWRRCRRPPSSQPPPGCSRPNKILMQSNGRSTRPAATTRCAPSARPSNTSRRRAPLRSGLSAATVLPEPTRGQLVFTIFRFPAKFAVGLDTHANFKLGIAEVVTRSNASTARTVSTFAGMPPAPTRPTPTASTATLAWRWGRRIT